MHDDIRLRAAVGLAFILLILLPVLFIEAGFRQANEESLTRQLQLAENQLKLEAQSFQGDLITRQRIEKIIKQAERHTGIAGAAADKPRFIKGVDPQIFNFDTVPELLADYRRFADVAPLHVVAYGADVRDIWSWYSADAEAIAGPDRNRIDWLISLVTSKQAGFERADDNNADAEANYQELCRRATGDDPGLIPAFNRLMRRHFSDMVFSLPHQGTCYETATRKMRSNKLFSYYRTVTDGNKIYGGYHVTFSNRQFPPQKLLADAISNESTSFTRSYLNRPPARPGRVIARKHRLQLEADVPAELTGYNSLFARQASLPGGLRIDHDVSGLYLETASFNRLLNLVQLSIMLVSFAAACSFILFGFPAVLRLRRRMLLAVGLAVLTPYIILGPVALRLLNRIESLGRFELRAESGSLMFRLQSYHDDQRQQYLLQTLKFKNRLTEIADLPAREIYELHAHNVVPAGTPAVLYFFRNDGIGRSFRAATPEVLSMPRVEWLFSVKHLDNLGVLDRDSPEIRKKLKMTTFADGLIDTVRQEYFDHQALQYEANETYDLGKVNEFSRMIWFLIPGSNVGTRPVRAMASTNLSSLRYLIYNPNEFDRRIFSNSSAQMQHDFIMGRRGHDDQVLQWWPSQISPDAELKRLLDEASSKRASMEQLNGSEGRYRLVRQRFNVKDTTVYAGISTSTPDMVLGLVSRAFPLLLLIFSLLSLLLFADVLAALFINPVKGIGRGAAAIEAGDYSQRVEIENTDEFSLLVTSFNQMTSGLAQREKMRRFVSDNLYARLGTQLGLNELRSVQTSRVTMLAADIRSFTTLSEKHDPQQIVSLLNDYFTAMEAAINAYGGVIERFVGDAVMAVFYQAGESSGEVQAAQAALAMRKNLEILNKERAACGLFLIENGIGIASGEAASGLVGSERGRMVFTVLGRVTRLAESLESQTKHVDSRILLCAATARVLGGRFVVRHSEKITHCDAYELVGVKPEAEDG